MAEDPEPGPAGIETREAILPDGKVVTIAVKAGTPQEQVDLIAAQIWQELPEG